MPRLEESGWICGNGNTSINVIIQRGTDFPLCIKLGGICRRSLTNQKERTRMQYSEEATGRYAYPSHKDKTQGYSGRTSKRVFGIGPQQSQPPVHPTAQADGYNETQCNHCGGRGHTDNNCPMTQPCSSFSKSRQSTAESPGQSSAQSDLATSELPEPSAKSTAQSSAQAGY